MAATEHRLEQGDSRLLKGVRARSVDLVVTSPPYPMIQMWDQTFRTLDSSIADCLDSGDGFRAFARMHSVLDRVWNRCVEALRDGGFLCVNIGDATRTIGGEFRLFPNHSRIIESCLALGLTPLPMILWEKQTNAPNKYMGSGMLPGGAYVTLEHEFILLFRKGPPMRPASAEDKERRRRSAYFWEERNRWFSDIWDFKGEKQTPSGPGQYERTGAFPLELPFRIIAMLSMYGDTVLDPFLGTGTTTLAAIGLARNSVGFELDSRILEAARSRIESRWKDVIERNAERLNEHLRFVDESSRRQRALRYTNEALRLPVMTQQETRLRVLQPTRVSSSGSDCIRAEYQDIGECRQPLANPRSGGNMPIDAWLDG